MLQILKIEWMKIKNYKVFKVFSILYIVSLFSLIFLCNYIYNDIVGRGPKFFNPFEMPIIWGNAAFGLGFLVYFPGIIIINLCVNEFSFKTHRQNIIDGWSRTNFLTGKFLVLTVFSMVITIVYVLAVLLFCAISKIDITSFDFTIIGGFFLQTFAYLLFAFTLAILFRRSGVAIIVFLIYGIIVENIFSGLLNWKASPIGYFLPLQSADCLTPGTVAGLDDSKLTMYKDAPDYLLRVAIVFGYCGLFVFLAYKKFVKDDL